MKIPIQLARHKSLDAYTMLLQAAEQASEYEEVVIYCRLKKPLQDESGTRADVWTTAPEKTLLWEASQTFADISFKEILSEP